MSLERKFWFTSVSIVIAVFVAAGSVLSFEYWKVKVDAQQLWNDQTYVSVTDEFVSSNQTVTPRLGASSDLVYLAGANKVVEPSDRGYIIYNLDSGMPEEVSLGEPLLNLQKVSDSQIGYLISFEGRNTLSLQNLSDNAVRPVTDAQNSPYNVQDWVALGETSLVFQEAGTNFMYLYNTETSNVEVIGQFDIIGGSAGDGQVWFYNTGESRTYSLYSSKTKTTTNLTFPVSDEHIVTQVTLLPSGDVLWRYTGLKSDVTENTQNIILQASNGYYKAVYEGSQQAEQFTYPVQYNTDGSLLAVAVRNSLSGESVIVLDSQTGTVIDQVPVNVLWFVP